MGRRFRNFKDLQFNNPSLKVFDLHLRDASRDEDIADALSNNDHVSELWLYLEHDSATANIWPNLCNSLSVRQNLAKVYLCCGGEKRGKSQVAILEAIGMNPHVLKVTVEEVTLSKEALRQCLDMGTSKNAVVEFRGCSSPTTVAEDNFFTVQGILF